MRKTRILAIDDEEAILKVMQRIFSEHEYYVATATNAHDGLNIFRKESFDVILLDLRLPDKNGLEVMKEIKGINIEIPVVMITGYATIENATTAIRSGACDYIMKPFKPGDLKEIVKEAIKRKAIEESIRRRIPEPRVLFVGLEAHESDEIAKKLRQEKIPSFFAQDINRAIEMLKSDGSQNTILCSLDEGADGLELLRRIKKINPEIIFIPITSRPEIAESIQMIKEGAFDYLIKPVEAEELFKILSQSWHSQSLNFINRQLVYDLQKINREIAQSYEYTACIVRSLNDMLVVTDLQGNISTVNRSACDILGYGEKELIGKPFEIILSGEDEDGRVIDGKLPDGEEVRNIEKRYRTRDGRSIPVFFSKSQMLDENGSVQGMLFVAQDLTEYKKAEEALQKSIAEVTASKTKNQFLAMTSYELLTPINDIIGMSRLLLDTDHSMEQGDHIQTIITSAESELEMINRILDYFRYESDILPPENSKFSVREEVENVGDLYALKAHEKGLELACIVKSPQHVELTGDSRKLRQILSYLTDNAIKFTKIGSVTLQVIVEEETKTHARLRFTVSDTGIGMHKSVIKNLFKPFTQADTSLKRKYKGMGLDLAVSKKLVEAMNGSIGVESVEGEGSSFWFSLIFEKEDKGSRVMPEVSCSYKALVIDDSTAARSALNEMLESIGLAVEEAGSGEEALNRMHQAIEAEKPFNLVFIDSEMPDIDGYTLGKQIKNTAGLAGVRLVLLNPRGNIEDLSLIEEIGFDTILTKPLKLARLYEYIEKYLQYCNK